MTKSATRVAADEVSAPIASPSFTGNVGIGVTPEAHHNTHSALQVGGNGVWTSYKTQGASGEMDFQHNAYYSQAHGGDRYISTDEATKYRQVSGAHQWYTAGSGSADAAISWRYGMQINNDGIVTKPLQPAFDVYRSDSSYNSGTTTASLNLNAARHNIGNHYNLSSRRFVAPVAGLYQFNFRTIVSGATNNAHLRMYKNGSQLQGGDSHYSSSNGSWGNWSYSLSTLLSANDYIEISTGATETIHGNSYQTFNGYLIG